MIILSLYWGSLYLWEEMILKRPPSGKTVVWGQYDCED